MLGLHNNVINSYDHITVGLYFSFFVVAFFKGLIFTTCHWYSSYTNALDLLF